MFREPRSNCRIAPLPVLRRLGEDVAEAEGPRSMHFREHPLLNTPNLTAILLRSAADGTASLDASFAHLEELLKRAGVNPPVARDEMRGRLKLLQADLALAGLLAPAGPERFGLTRRGRAALDEHPAGLSRADLMAYPEFAAHVAARGRNHATSDPHLRAYDAGFDAFLTGKDASENPHPPDTADHLAWENGWSQALDHGRG
jgi:hypothetical protein